MGCDIHCVFIRKARSFRPYAITSKTLPYVDACFELIVKRGLFYHLAFFTFKTFKTASEAFFSFFLLISIVL